MMSRVFSNEAISFPSSPSKTTNSNLQSRSDGRPKRPQTDGRLGLHRKRKFDGKKRSYTCSGVYLRDHSGKSGCVFCVGRAISQFNATHVSS